VKDLEWSRSDALVRLQRDIWRYVTRASTADDEVVLMAAALLQMPAGQLRFLARLQFILSEAVGRLLEEMPFLVRRLTTTTINELEVSAERVRGAIRWGETFAQRAAGAPSHAFVTAPTRRAFDTPENLVLVFALRAIAEFGQRTGWASPEGSGPAQEIHDRVAEATRWRQARALTGIDAAPPAPVTVARVRGSRVRRRYQSALDVIDLYARYIARLDRQALRAAVEHHGLVASQDSVLLELECAFDTVRTLRELGWAAPADALLRPPLIFHGTRRGAVLELFYQAASAGLAKGSRYGIVQREHALRPSALRPDLVIRLRDGHRTRWLLIEVKGGPKRGVADSARAALLDLLAYRRAFDPVLRDQPGVYGLGYAWGAQLDASTTSEVALCSPDTLPDALARIFDAWQT